MLDLLASLSAKHASLLCKLKILATANRLSMSRVYTLHVLQSLYQTVLTGVLPTLGSVTLGCFLLSSSIYILTACPKVLRPTYSPVRRCIHILRLPTAIRTDCLYRPHGTLLVCCSLLYSCFSTANEGYNRSYYCSLVYWYPYTQYKCVTTAV